MQRRLRLALLLSAICFSYLLDPHDSLAKKPPPCGSVQGDRAAIVSLRATGSTECPCADHGRYIRCMTMLAKDAAKQGTLRSPCKKSLVQAARQSICHQPGAQISGVTCCLETRKGKKTCKVKPVGRCRAPRGGTARVGSSDSCDDGCLPSISHVSPSSSQIRSAVETGLQGVSDPWGTGLGLVLLRSAAELGSRLDPSNAAPQASATTACQTTYCSDVLYCGTGNSQTDPGPCLITDYQHCHPPVGSCLNQACFAHDVCYGQNCIDTTDPCYFRLVS